MELSWFGNSVPSTDMARGDIEKVYEEEEELMSSNDQHRNRNAVPRRSSTSEAAASLFRSYFSRRFMSGRCVIRPR